MSYHFDLWNMMIGFRRFIVVSFPSFRIPSRKTVRAKCIFLNVRAKWLKEFFIESCAGRVSITTYTWTLLKNLSYMCITAHYVSKDWKLHKKIINLRKITSHKGDDIQAKIDECLEERGLNNLFKVTLDNASVNDVPCTFLKGI
ncbi:Zinc finger BED domain-containing protein DAYSLEEPER [Linum perenne]